MPYTLSAAGDQLISQLSVEILSLFPTGDPIQVRMKIAGVLSLYDIRPARLPGANPDFKDKADQYLSAKRLEGLSDYTLDSYQRELRIFSQHVFKPIEEITTVDIRQYLSRFDNLKMSTISTKLSAIKSFFSWLSGEDIIMRDPARRIKPPKQGQRLPKALNIEELELIRESCISSRERALIEVLYATGGRLSEIQSLDKSDIDYQGMCARVIGKGDKEREVYLSHKAIYHLRKYLMTRLDNEPALFITDRRPYHRLSNRGIQRVVKTIADRSGIQKKISPHTFRHTFAMLTLNNGADLSAVQALLGHMDPATTQVYAQVTQERKREAYRKHLVQ